MAASIETVTKPHETFDNKIADVLSEIKNIDERIQRLNERRQCLVAKYEELNDAKLVKESETITTQGDWEKETFSWSEEVRKKLETVFKLKEFRPQQLQAINCIMAKKDVIMIAPTGGGKSLCYQLPAILSDGLSIVVSPLISLMEDQVWSLKKFGIEAELLSASTDKNKNNAILKQMMEKTNKYPFKLLYVTPERLAKSKRFMNALQKCYLAKKLFMIAIDEVHCCSQWGHDFRPDYKFLGTLKTMFPDVPLLGVTATATTKVILDVQKMLNVRQTIVLKAPFNRPNLYYHIMEKPSDKEQCIGLLHDLLSKRYVGKSGIIYTFSIADTEELASALVSKGLNVRPYHANLTSDRRTKIHCKWLSGSIQAVVATVAFGMGIDKPDVRFVIHHTISKSMENFYQESGRAGRDGSRAECILLYRYLDMSKITTMMFTEHTGLKNAYEMVEFAIDGISCRRDLISKHFLEVWSSSTECNKMCDRCYHKDSVNPPKMIVTDCCLELYKIIDHAVSIDIKLTGLKLVDAWYQKGKPNLRVKEVAVPNFERYYAEQIVAFLIVKGYLKEDFHFSTYTTYSYIRKGSNICKANDRIVFYGARVLHLPHADKDLWTNTADEDCMFVTEEAEKRRKKSKKDKHSRDKSHERSSCFNSPDDSSANNSSIHNSSINNPFRRKLSKETPFRSNSSAKIKRRRLSSDIVSISSANTHMEELYTPKSNHKKKLKTKIKIEKKTASKDKVDETIEKDDDCLVVTPNDDIIEIED